MTAKRGPIAFVAAAAGFVGALGFHASGSATPLASTSGAPSNSHSGSVAAQPPSKRTSNSEPTAGPGTTLHSNPAGSVSSLARSVTGTTEQYGYGQLAVQVIVHGTKITGLGVVGLQTAESYSQQIADQVIPMLRGEVLAAQSAQVNGISGATYTTEAYLYSIQSALDKLHIK